MNNLFVDDHTLFREGFKIMLERCWDMPLHIVEVSTAETCRLKTSNIPVVKDCISFAPGFLSAEGSDSRKPGAASRTTFADDYWSNSVVLR